MDNNIIKKDIEILSNTPDNLSQLSDGNHTFDELYNHRNILFAALCNSMSDKAWKSKCYEDGNTIEDNYFLAGIIPDDNSYSAIRYHIPNSYWNLFNCKELDKCPAWNGSSDDDCISDLNKYFCKENIYEGLY